MDLIDYKSKFVVALLLLLFCLNAKGQSDSSAVLHKVLYGENLYRISLRYKVSIDQIKQWNKLSSNAIRQNQELVVGYKIVPAPAQPVTPTPRYEYTARLQEIVKQVESLYYELLAPGLSGEQPADPEMVNELFLGQYSEVSDYELMKLLNDARIAGLKEDVGLGFYGGVTHNFRPGVFDGEDLFFRNRASVGLDWRLLKDGLGGNKDAIERLRIENEINDLLKVRDAKSRNYVYQYNYLIYLFNKSQQGLIQRRLAVLTNFLDLASQMYLVRAMPWEQIIDIKSKKESLESMSRNLTNYNAGFDSVYSELMFDRTMQAHQLPVLEIIPEKVFSGVALDSVQKKALSLNKERLDIEYKKTKDLALRTFVRYNLFDGNEGSLRTFGSVGATFTAPLFRNKKNDRLKEMELAVEESKMKTAVTSINNELMNHYYEYEYSLKQYLDFYGKRELQLELLRRELAKDYLNDPDFTPLAAIRNLDLLLAVEFDLLDIKQKLYLKLLKIYSLLNVEQLTEITEPLNLGQLFDKMAGQRAVYAWSATLAAYDPAFMAKYAANNEFERVFLSQGNLADSLAATVVSRFKKEKIEVYKLVGNNALARSPSADRINVIYQEAVKQDYSGIQLDIEPHTFDDWETNKATYLANLLTVVDGLKRLGDMKVSVSLPVFYPEGFLSNLSAQVDELVIMCYERPELEFITQQIKEELSIAGDKVSLALRTNDFADRLEMENFIKKLIGATGINKLVIHDLGSLMKLDQQTILAK